MTAVEAISERFQQETANHQMTVKHDDGPYRHIRFMDPKYSGYWFDLITVPGALIFQGDGETFAFRRIEDMFQFFRSGLGKDGSVHINPQYWAEKLTSDRDSVMTYDEDLLKRQVAEELTEAEEDYPGITEAWNAQTDGVLPEYYTGTEEEARTALDNFEFIAEATRRSGAESNGDTITLIGHGLGNGDRIVFTNTGFSVRVLEGQTYHVVSSTATTFKVAKKPGGEPLEIGAYSRLAWTGVPFQFYDTWEWQLKDYDWWFLWALHGIVWGIAQYDASKTAKAEPQAVAS